MPGIVHADGRARHSQSNRRGLDCVGWPCAAVTLPVASGAARPLPDEPFMSPEADHFRLAVATFDAPGSLGRAVDALVAAGVSTDQICLVARRETFVGLVQSPAATGGSAIQRLTSALDTWPGSGASVQATAGLLRDSLTQLHLLDPQKSSDCGSQAAQRPDFGDSVPDGAVTLIVRSRTPAQQSIATRTLLSQSSNRVKTYEFTFAACSAKKH